MSSQRRIVPITKNGSSPISTASAPEKIATQVSAAVTDEDRALDRLLASRELDSAPAGVDLTPGPVLRRNKEVNTHLKDFMEDGAEYVPANNLVNLEQQVFEARAAGCDTIEVIDKIFLAIFGYVPAEDYAIYKNIKMYKIGRVEAGRAADKGTIEQRLFANSKLPTEAMTLENIGAKK